VLSTFRNLLFGAPAEPEAPADAEFGKYLFATSRKDVPRPKEPNTTTEEEFESALRAWFEYNNGNPLIKLLPVISSVMRKNQYQPLLDPGGIEVYRGLKMPEQKFKKDFGDVEISPGDWVEFNKPHTLHPHGERKLQSWSSSADIASDFSGFKMASVLDWYCVVFTARTDTPSNFFFGKPGKLASAASPKYTKEQEVISVGPVVCSNYKVLRLSKKPYTGPKR
jgi:hypothetical protein